MASRSASALREIDTQDEREKILALYRGYRREFKAGRIDVPRQMPPLSGHNIWDSEHARFDALYARLRHQARSSIRSSSGFFKRRGGINIEDDRRRFCAASTEEWLKAARSIPTAVTVTFVNGRGGDICIWWTQGLGCWQTDAFAVFCPAEILAALGFTTAVPSSPSALANPIGLDGIFEAYCPPFYPNIDYAVGAALAFPSAEAPGIG